MDSEAFLLFRLLIISAEAVVVNHHGETNIEGFSPLGRFPAHGLHGANRLRQAILFSKR
jgi:hypothetical protein